MDTPYLHDTSAKMRKQATEEELVDILVRKELAGWLLKKGWMSSKFSRRWFTLQDDKLVYREHKTHSEIRNGISLKDDCKVRLLYSAENQKYGVHYGFLVGTDTRVFILACDTSEEVAKWTQAIHNAISRLRWKQGQSPSRASKPSYTSFLAPSFSSSPENPSSFFSAFFQGNSSALTQDPAGSMVKYSSYDAQVASEGSPPSPERTIASSSAPPSGQAKRTLRFPRPRLPLLHSEVLLDEHRSASEPTSFVEDAAPSWVDESIIEPGEVRERGRIEPSYSQPNLGSGTSIYHKARSDREADTMRKQAKLIDTIAELKQSVFSLEVELRQREAQRYTPDRIAMQLRLGNSAPMYSCRSIQEKSALLRHVAHVKPAPPDVLVAVMSFLYNSLTLPIFKTVVNEYDVAVDTFVAHLRRQAREDVDEVGQSADLLPVLRLLELLGRHQEILAVKLEIAYGAQIPRDSARKLNECALYLDEHQERFDCGWEYKQVLAHARLLERQQQMKEEKWRRNQAPTQTEQQLLKTFPPPKLLGSSLNQTLQYCCFYHPQVEASDIRLPANLVRSFSMSTIRLVLVQLEAFAKRGDWEAVKALLANPELACATLPLSERNPQASLLSLHWEDLLPGFTFSSTGSSHLSSVAGPARPAREAQILSQRKSSGSDRAKQWQLQVGRVAQRLEQQWRPLGVEVFMQTNLQYRGPPRDLDEYVNCVLSPVKRFRLSVEYGLWETSIRVVPELKAPKLWLMLADIIYTRLGHIPRTSALRMQIHDAISRFVQTGDMGGGGLTTATGHSSFASVRKRQELKASWEKTDLFRHARW
eukprot:gb/GEZN01002167.1/.p1 GENE.gb/GEZN01002167.1/~~gb/GEZN01002167.1/.p1  ORF type:complete len:817 (+),score=132.78 gb/GEZN01002167.1/:56-2506(+)